ncbi:hypothetical protein BFX31_14530 [Vibrio paracholerae]|nr:hypothetical protein BFX31_14530 [Vibrio paracholerae]
MRFYLISYFIRHLSNEHPQFVFLPRYNIELFIAENTHIKEGKRVSKDLVMYSRVKLRFKPKQVCSKRLRVLSGIDSGSMSERKYYLSYDHLAHMKVYIHIEQNRWSDSTNTYSTFTLLKYYLYRKFAIFYLAIAWEKISWLRNRIFHRLRPLDVVKSKYEIFQAIFESKDFVKSGLFNQSDLIDLLYPKKEYKGVIPRTVISNYIKLVIDSAIESGELASINKDRPNEIIKVTGLGINFYTETKEAYKKDVQLLKLQKSQTVTQRTIAWLTLVLAIATLLTLVDKVDLILYWWNYLWCLYEA